MRAAEGFSEEFYGGLRDMRASVVARAAFENRPLTELYFSKLFKEFRAAEVAYAESRDAKAFGAGVDRRIADSLRNVDALLAQGTTLRKSAGVYEVGRRTIAGVDYAVKAWDDRRQKRLVRACVPVKSGGALYDIPLFKLSGLSKSQVRAFRCRYTTGGPDGTRETAARLDLSEPRRPALCVEIKCEPYEAGGLEVVFYNGTGRASRPTRYSFRGYTFAVPDRQELHKLIKRRR
jgi:hypothetical protein